MPGLEQHFSTRQETIIALIHQLVERETTSREAARLDEIARNIS